MLRLGTARESVVTLSAMQHVKLRDDRSQELGDRSRNAVAIQLYDS